MAIAMAGRMPVSALQEYAVKHLKALPTYEYSDVSPIGCGFQFKCICTCEGITNEAMAPNKKDSKHKAAFLVLKEICLRRSDLHFLKNVNQTFFDKKHSINASACSDPSENFIGLLNVYCSGHGFKYPVYNTIEETPVFVVECKHENIIERGSGKTVKSAKQDSARLVLETIRDPNNSSFFKNRMLDSKTDLNIAKAHERSQFSTNVEDLSHDLIDLNLDEASIFRRYTEVSHINKREPTLSLGPFLNLINSTEPTIPNGSNLTTADHSDSEPTLNVKFFLKDLSDRNMAYDISHNKKYKDDKSIYIVTFTSPNLNDIIRGESGLYKAISKGTTYEEGLANVLKEVRYYIENMSN